MGRGRQSSPGQGSGGAGTGSCQPPEPGQGGPAVRRSPVTAPGQPPWAATLTCLEILLDHAFPFAELGPQLGEEPAVVLLDHLLPLHEGSDVLVKCVDFLWRGQAPGSGEVQAHSWAGMHRVHAGWGPTPLTARGSWVGSGPQPMSERLSPAGPASRAQPSPPTGSLPCRSFRTKRACCTQIWALHAVGAAVGGPRSRQSGRAACRCRPRGCPRPTSAAPPCTARGSA